MGLKVDEIEAIFDYLYGRNNNPLPTNLAIQILPLWQTDTPSKFTLPNLLYSEGLFVLLHSGAIDNTDGDEAKKRKREEERNNYDSVPDHLKHLVSPVASDLAVSWRLSGPQFPKPTKLQQRDCPFFSRKFT